MTGLAPSPPRAFRGYAPLVGLLAVLVAFTALVPSTGREVEAVAGANRGPGVSAGPAAGPTATVPRGGDAAGPTDASGSPGAASASGSAPGGCPDRALQVPGDPYSPPCVSFAGDNGGATSRGVTADSVAVAWRFTDDTALAGALQSAVGNRVDISDSPQDVRRTIEALVEYFNEHFQMYGRRIDLQMYDGRGSYATEVLGSGQENAAADAVTVADQIGAFMDANGYTAPYADALARRQVVALGMRYLSDEWYDDRHPYVWGTISCSQLVRQIAEYANRRLFDRPARYAGDGLRDRPRRIGLIAPENAYYQECVDTLVADLDTAGNSLAVNLSYALDVNTLSQDSSSMVARLADEGVTTVICFTDPVSPILLTAKATQQRYFPEWVIIGTTNTDHDLPAQQYHPEQWQHAFGLRTLTAPVAIQTTDAYAAFKSVRPDQEPAAIALSALYERLYMVALGIQLAGPDLTPASFAAGLQSYAGGTGELGGWVGRPGSHTVLVDAEEVRWDPDAISGYNGQAGAYVATTPRYRLGEWPEGQPELGR